MGSGQSRQAAQTGTPNTTSPEVRKAVRGISMLIILAGTFGVLWLTKTSTASTLPEGYDFARAARSSVEVTARGEALRPALPAPAALTPEPARATGALTAFFRHRAEEVNARLFGAAPPAPVVQRPAPAWMPPEWLGTSEALLALSQMDQPGPRTGGPPLRSRSAFIFDAGTGQVLYEKNADEIRPVASLTKLISSLALISSSPDLEQRFCIGAAQYPTRNGAISKLSTGDCIQGWDTVGAALVSSDNRGAYGMAAAAGMDLDPFIARMNTVSQELGMEFSTWSDPSGLEDDNRSTAREMAKATWAVANQPTLSPIASAPWWDLHRSDSDGSDAEIRRLFSTDRLVGRTDIEILAAKTGYTDTARYCFTVALLTRSGRPLVITLLGAEGKQSRWADVSRVLSWVDDLPAEPDAAEAPLAALEITEDEGESTE